MMAMHFILFTGALFIAACMQWNKKNGFSFSSRTLLRLSQVFFLFTFLAPVLIEILPHAYRPVIPMRYQFPVENVGETLRTSFSTQKPIVSHPIEDKTVSKDAFTGNISFLWEVLYGISLILFLRFLANISQIRSILKKSHLIKKVGRVRIGTTKEVSVPFSFLYGAQAWVVIPETLLLSGNDFRIAAQHELQHHRQRDTVWVLFTELAGCFLYMNPGFYLWKKIFSELQELSCDEALIGHEKVSLQDYGSCLVRVAEAALEQRILLAGTANMASVFGNPKKNNSQLKRRIDMFKQHLSSRPQVGRSLILGTCMALFTFVIAYGASAKFEDANTDRTNLGSLVLNPEIQKIAEKALESAVKKFKATSGFAIVSEPKTGRLLAVANTVQLKSSDVPEHWALKLRLEPASTMKALIAARAVDLKKANYDEQLDCGNGKLVLGENLYNDWRAFDKLSVRDTVVNSSNICGIKIAQRLGPDGLFSLLKDFGFGQGGVSEDFPGARAGQVFEPGDTKSVQFPARLGTGYGIHITPLEMVQAFGAIANGGNLMKPIMANKDASSAEVIRRVLSEETAEETRKVLREVIIRGTGKGRESKLYDLAGKTASSSSAWLWGSNEQGGETNVGSFIGFGPTEDPKVLIYVGIYEPQDWPDHSAHGATHGLPVFREIAEKVLQHMHVAPKS